MDFWTFADKNIGWIVIIVLLVCSTVEGVVSEWRKNNRE